jgi:hypothetical protein
MAGRLIDGFGFAVDGEPIGWNPPRWLRDLEGQGYDPSLDGEPAFVVSHLTVGELRRFANLRDALRYGRSLLERRRSRFDPDSLAIECRTLTRRVVPVVRGHAVLGMARGALDAEPITTVEAPAD